MVPTSNILSVKHQSFERVPNAIKRVSTNGPAHGVEQRTTSRPPTRGDKHGRSRLPDYVPCQVTFELVVWATKTPGKNKHCMTSGHGRLWPNRLSPNRLWPAFWRPSLAKPTVASVSVLVVWPTLAKTDFGQTDFDLWCCVLCVVCGVFVCVCVRGCLVSRFHGVVWVLVSRFWSCSVPPGPPFPDRPSRGPPFPGTALPEDRPTRGPTRRPPFPRPSPGPPKISLFFSLSRLKIRSFLPSLGVLSWTFDKCARLEFSGCRVKPRRPEAAGVSHYNQRTPTLIHPETNTHT